MKNRLKRFGDKIEGGENWEVKQQQNIKRKGPPSLNHTKPSMKPRIKVFSYFNPGWHKLGGSREKEKRKSWMKGKQLIINVPKLEHNSFCMLATNLNLRFLDI